PIERWNESLPPGRWIEIEPELVETVLDESAASADGERIEAPFLQLVMQRIWDVERGRGSNVLRLSTLRELGGARTLVREHLDRALAGLEDDQQDTAARMFGHLVTPSGTKIAHRASDLATLARVPPADSERVLAAL